MNFRMTVISLELLVEVINNNYVRSKFKEGKGVGNDMFIPLLKIALQYSLSKRMVYLQIV